MTTYPNPLYAIIDGRDPDLLDDTDSDWSPIDLAAVAARIRAGDHEATVPTVLAVEGSIPLFYAERINSLFGESGGGKTWVALAAVAEVANAGGNVLFVDYEDTPNGIAERLVLMGMDDDAIARVDYRNPTTGIGTGLEQLVGPYALAVIDSTGEAMAAGSVDSNADREVAQWFALVKRLARLPGAPAVVVLDHIPKDKDAPSAYAIGSQRKRAAITGASYRVDTLREPARGRDGKLKLTTAKDRLGTRVKNAAACEIDIISGIGSVTMRPHVTEAQAAAAAGERFRPTVLMERVSVYLEGVTSASGKLIEKNVTGKASGLRQAVEALVEDGFVAVDNLGYRSIRAYREGTLVPSSHPRPTLVPEAGDDPRPLVPPYPPRGGDEGAGVHAGADHHQGSSPGTTPIEEEMF